MQPVAAQNPTTVSKQESLILANDIGGIFHFFLDGEFNKWDHIIHK